MGNVLEQIMQERRSVVKHDRKRRNSAKDKLQIPLADGKRIQRFKIEDQSVTEEQRAKAVKNFEAQRQKQDEWRSQHTTLFIKQEDAQKKRASSEV